MSAQPPCSWKALLFLGLPSSSKKNSCGVSDHRVAETRQYDMLTCLRGEIKSGKRVQSGDCRNLAKSKKHLLLMNFEEERKNYGKCHALLLCQQTQAALQPRYGLRSQYSGLSVPITMGSKYYEIFCLATDHTHLTLSSSEYLSPSSKYNHLQ